MDISFLQWMVIGVLFFAASSLAEILTKAILNVIQKRKYRKDSDHDY